MLSHFVRRRRFILSLLISIPSRFLLTERIIYLRAGDRYYFLSLILIEDHFLSVDYVLLNFDTLNFIILSNLYESHSNPQVVSFDTSFSLVVSIAYYCSLILMSY